LNNSRALEKGQLYSFLKSLLGEGLLTASGIYIRFTRFYVLQSAEQISLAVLNYTLCSETMASTM
jgi:hypothetical protein